MSELDNIAGEAVFASHLAFAVVLTLVQEGILPKERIIDRLDDVLLVLEQADATQPQNRAAYSHARSRLRSLIELLSAPPGRA